MSIPVPDAAADLGWTPQRERRRRLLVLTLVVAAAAGLFFTFQTWFAFSMTGTPTCEPAPTADRVAVRSVTTDTRIDGVYAADCLRGSELASAFAVTDLDRQQAAQLAALSGHTALAQDAGPKIVAGLPRATVLLLAALGLGVLGATGRNGFLTGLGVVAMYYAHKDLGNLAAFMTGGTGGSLTATMAGFERFGMALMAGWMLLGAGTAWLVKVNSDQRAVERVLAERAGTAAPLSPLDHATAFVGNRLAKLVDAVVEQREANKTTA